MIPVFVLFVVFPELSPIRLPDPSTRRVPESDILGATEVSDTSELPDPMSSMRRAHELVVFCVFVFPEFVF